MHVELLVRSHYISSRINAVDYRHLVMERLRALPMQHLMATVLLALVLGLAFLLEQKFQELEEELVFLKRNYKTLETECDMLKSKAESYEHVFSKVNGSLKDSTEQVRVIQTDVGTLKIHMENFKQAAVNTGKNEINFKIIN